jgi:SET domain-containing protein
VIEKHGLVLEHSKTGLCVRTTEFIRAGECIAPYVCVLSTFNFQAPDEQVSEYALVTNEKFKGAKVYVDAAAAGNISRFMNHSCLAKAEFIERRYRRKLAIMVSAIEDILPGEEVTVWYGDELWLACKCGAENCVALQM